jgi:hypothetical protein
MRFLFLALILFCGCATVDNARHSLKVVFDQKPENGTYPNPPDVKIESMWEFNK